MGVERGLRVEVEVLDNERTSTPAVFKDIGRCLTLPAAAPCRLIVVIGVICSSVWRAMSAARTPDALVLDVESCNQLAGCPGCALNRTRPRARGGGGNRRALGRGPKTSGRSGDADFAAHQSEAEDRYGDTDDWRESRVRTASWQAADWRQNAERFQDIECRMIDAICDGAAPDSERAAGLVEEHREALSEFFPVTPAKHYIMSRGYIHDERFREHYDSQQVGFAQWLADAIEAVARQQGVDLESPTWE